MTVRNEQAGSRKALADAHTKEIREDHVRKPDEVCNFFKARESELWQ